MAGAANPEGLLDCVPGKVAFVFAIVMPGAGDEVVARERLEPPANGTLTVHDPDCWVDSKLRIFA
jgi:hypothetical protein